MERYSRTERARQFMPFAALKGYETLLHEQERLETPRRLPSEEKSIQLSVRLSQVKKGENVETLYYENNAYQRINGVVRDIDYTYKTITIDNCKILFSDIFDFKILRK
ncbi:MAG: hypothetical protein IJW79_01430 [Clostridia bacterium]|nr:hypothetical protein [Clostridia bacterium]